MMLLYGLKIYFIVLKKIRNSPIATNEKKRKIKKKKSFIPIS